MNAATQDTRQYIINSGYQLIALKGFSNVGLAEILKAANVPKGSFYHYFKSKEQFGEALIQDYFDSYSKMLDRLFDDTSLTAYEQLMSYWQRWLDTQCSEALEHKCLVVKLGAEVADLSEPMRLVVLKGTEMVVQRIANCIEDGISDCSIPSTDSKAMASMLYEMWLGASLMSKLHRSDEPLSRVFATTQKVLSGQQQA